ncbi:MULTISPECIES: glutathione S-transferase [Roseobacter]|uniref:glutathione S-transferase n=1 Tax=Roseobacter TaxID=2433 RepID=UPI001BB9B24B|nr:MULTISPECIES: glutathione S-transferase [Roseobacter]GIT86185.1 glutathione S-transferase [Roseobacter sp. OBYS 0001]
MKLYHSPASPFVRKVTVLLHELGQTDAVTLKTVTTTALASDEALKTANPLARLPALERDDGITLYDSRVITAYLNDLFNGTFYPQNSSRWETLTLEATGDGIMDSGVSMVYELRLRDAERVSQAWIDAQWAKIERTLFALNTRWISHLSGPLTMGHISVACALSYLDFRHDARNWREGNEALAKWHAGFDSRPSMRATHPPAA